MSDDGCYLATPLLLVIVVVELLYVMFALDSVPAMLRLSKQTLVIYSGNILAVMDLRSLFFVVRQVIKGMLFLNQAVASELPLMLTDCLLHNEIPVLNRKTDSCNTYAGSNLDSGDELVRQSGARTIPNWMLFRFSTSSATN